nr:hypothetical protein [Tanacetum cinerariifolium]
MTDALMVDNEDEKKTKEAMGAGDDQFKRRQAEIYKIDMDHASKVLKQIEEEENRAIQSINETPAQKAAKRRKLNEEVKDLKQHLEIMPDKDYDVYTEATPLARKVPV